MATAGAAATVASVKGFLGLEPGPAQNGEIDLSM